MWVRPWSGHAPLSLRRCGRREEWPVRPRYREASAPYLRRIVGAELTRGLAPQGVLDHIFVNPLSVTPVHADIGSLAALDE
jgi:hypothetical protein